MEDVLMNYIRPELLVLVPVLYFLGLALKKSNLNDKYIPLVLGACGIVLAILYTCIVSKFNLEAIFIGLTQGVLCAALSVYVNQNWKQLFNKKTDTDSEEIKKE